jgi:PPOX class probable F420-dependent enzyme
MDIDQVREFLSKNHHAILATSRADGRTQLSPVAVSIDEAGRAVVSTREGAAKTRNLRRNSTATLCVFTDQFFGPWIQIEGTCEIVSLPEAMDGLIAYFKSVSEEHPNWDDYRASMIKEERVLFRIEMQHIGPQSA